MNEEREEECFCCGAACGSMIASEKRQAYYVNGDRSRVRTARRHLLRPAIRGSVELVFADAAGQFVTPCRVTVRAGSEVREVEIAAGTLPADAVRIIASAWAGRPAIVMQYTDAVDIGAELLGGGDQ